MSSRATPSEDDARDFRTRFESLRAVGQLQLDCHRRCNRESLAGRLPLPERRRPLSWAGLPLENIGDDFGDRQSLTAIQLIEADSQASTQVVALAQEFQGFIQNLPLARVLARGRQLAHHTLLI